MFPWHGLVPDSHSLAHSGVRDMVPVPGRVGHRAIGRRLCAGNGQLMRPTAINEDLHAPCQFNPSRSTPTSTFTSLIENPC